MKQDYVQADIEIITFDEDDIITTSLLSAKISDPKSPFLDEHETLPIE